MNSPPLLPVFRFHADPIASGSVGASEKTCQCCQQARGFIYSGPVYAQDDLEDALCPWCIADGSACRKFDVTFVDCNAFDDDAEPGVADEICTRTPGFRSFQSERWPSCCDQPATFLTPAGIAEIRRTFPIIEGGLMTYIVHHLGISGGAARRMLESLHRDHSPTAFVFQCRKCERPLGYVDYV